eukprot:Awhi_evm1s12379
MKLLGKRPKVKLEMKVERCLSDKKTMPLQEVETLIKGAKKKINPTRNDVRNDSGDDDKGDTKLLLRKGLRVKKEAKAKNRYDNDNDDEDEDEDDDDKEDAKPLRKRAKIKIEKRGK